MFSITLFSLLSHICSHNRSNKLTPPFSFINEINSVYQCIKVHTLMQYLCQISTHMDPPHTYTRIQIYKQTRTQICEMRLFVFSNFSHIYRLVCVSFLINRLNSWLFHQYKFWRAIESFSVYACVHCTPSYVYMCICLYSYTCLACKASFFVWSVVLFSHFLFQSKNNSQFSRSLFLRIVVPICFHF